MNKINVFEKLSSFQDYWDPKIVGELNEQYVKLAKFKGEFVWHTHENEDEMFFVLNGELIMEFRDHKTKLQENEFIVVPRGTEHRPVAKKEVAVMLIEPKSTINTGDKEGNMTLNNLDNI